MGGQIDLSLRKNTDRVFENNVLRRVFGERRNLYEELHNVPSDQVEVAEICEAYNVHREHEKSLQ
jgi:hypothetical protein